MSLSFLQKNRTEGATLEAMRLAKANGHMACVNSLELVQELAIVSNDMDAEARKQAATLNAPLVQRDPRKEEAHTPLESEPIDQDESRPLMVSQAREALRVIKFNPHAPIAHFVSTGHLVRPI
ncbi:Aste57867_11988 [Aphanomyces stellatus]|uniref:Aste57867_11988 protein n=1 Tax=Aphanomyces stellatus TaxID=120398 RepID=A0A485KVL8_9STRA|nr:hypothetical protein As57867_011943 [Aphanomyces stellatus]VFT88843.1 Aste57867_11988 [Aphanomyces stellatus]